MKNLLRIFFNNAEAGGGSPEAEEPGAVEQLENALTESENNTESGAEPIKEETTPAAEDQVEKGLNETQEPEAAAEGEGKDKDDAKAKAEELLNKEVTIDTPEGQVTAKVSDILEWKKNGMLHSDYTQKTQALAEQQAALKELSAVNDYLNQNKALGRHVVQIIDDFRSGKIKAGEDGRIITGSEEPESNPDDDLLSTLDDNDPVHRLLKQQYQQNQQLQTQLQQLTQNHETTQQQQAQAQEQELIKQIHTTMEDSLKAVEDEARKEHDFLNDEHIKMWKRMVYTQIQQEPDKFQNKEDIAKVTKELGQAFMQNLTSVGEARLKKHLQSKSGPTPPGPGSQTPAENKPKEITLENVEDVLTQELSNLNQ